MCVWLVTEVRGIFLLLDIEDTQVYNTIRLIAIILSNSIGQSTVAILTYDLVYLKGCYSSCRIITGILLLQ